MAQHVGVFAGMRDAGLEPRPALLERVVPRLGEGAFGDAEEQVGEGELGDQRAQAGERRAQRPRFEQQLVLLDAHALEGDAAAVGLPLAHVVPVAVQGDAAAPAGDGGDQQLAAAGLVERRGDQHFRVGRAGTEALAPGELAPAVELLRHGAGVQRVQGVAPEPVLARGLLEPGLPLVRPGEQAHGGQHQVLEAVDVGDRAVDPGELADDLEGLAPAGALAAVLLRNAQGQQAAAAQGVALGFRRAAAQVALDGGFGERGRQLAGCLQRRQHLGLMDSGHTLFLWVVVRGR
ncbi:hypothetical protein D3C78_1076600 [compost metagenome]